MDSEEQVPCSNCNKPQGVSRVHLHEAYCLRNISKCPDCDEFVDKREMAKHKEEAHTTKPCKFCKNQFLPTLLEMHERVECERKPEKCAYCTLDIPSVDFTEHVSACGARTKECFICNKYVVLFNFDNHIQTCVGEQPYEEQFPSHTSVLGQSAVQQNNNKVPMYNPVQPTRATTRVKIGLPGAASVLVNQNTKDNGQSDEFLRRMKLATQNNDAAEIKKLQEEEDERLALEMMKDFSPKQKESGKQVLTTKKEPSNNFSDYDYEDDYYDYNHIEDDHYNQEASKNAQGATKTTGTSQQNKAVKELEEMGEFCEDPELQEAILQSQQFK